MFLKHMLYGFIRLLHWTYRYDVIQSENRRAAEALHAKGGFVMALWHENLLATVVALRFHYFYAMTSPSHDGDFVAHVIQRFGFHPVRGSSSRGGLKARAELEEILKRGDLVALTVDGPRGPRQKCKSGAVMVVRAGGGAVLPVAVRARRNFVFKKTWDQFRLPMPFTRIVVAYGKPIPVPPESDRQAVKALQETVAEGLRQVEHEADRYLGVPVQSGHGGTAHERSLHA